MGNPMGCVIPKQSGSCYPRYLPPTPSLEVRGSDCPSRGSLPLITPREVLERLFGKRGRKCKVWGKNNRNNTEPVGEMMVGMLGWGLVPPSPRTGGDWGWVWVRSCKIPAGIKWAAETIPSGGRCSWRPPPAPSWTQGGSRVVLGSVPCPEVGMEMPGTHPTRKKGKSWELKPSLHARPQQEPEENLLYGAKILYLERH